MKRVLAVLSLFLAFGAGMAVARGRAQAKPRMWGDVLLDVVTDELPRRARVHVNLDHWDPEAETGRHRHPGPTLIVIVDGELQELFGDGGSRVLKAGQAVWDRAGTDHTVKNVGNRPARALAVHLDPAP